MNAERLPASHRPKAGVGEVPPRSTDRLFFALYPDAGAASRLAELAQGLKRSHGLQGRVFEPRRFHVTLQFLGDHAGLPSDLLARAQAAGQSLAHRGEDPIELRFTRVLSFSGRPGHRPLVLLGRDDDLAPLQALHDRLGEALAEAGWSGPLSRRFTPHVTLMYDAQGLVEEAVAPIGWSANEFVLVHSLVGRSIHRPLARWALH